MERAFLHNLKVIGCIALIVAYHIAFICFMAHLFLR
jgi:hypothetical protein